jgi:hypothetical protein
MTKKLIRSVTILVFLLTALVIGALYFLPDLFLPPQNGTQKQTRVVIPQTIRADNLYESASAAEQMAYEDSITAKVALDDGETLVTVLTQDFDGDQQEEQIIAYRNLLEIESPIYITYIDYDNIAGGYKRLWSIPTAATRPGTVTLYTQDMIGDRSVCVLVSGMNGAGEHTLTVFRKNNNPPTDTAPYPEILQGNQPFIKIAELRIDGSITIQEAERTQAYQMGLSKGQSNTIVAYGRDYESSNMLDQIEITYTYNAVNGLYEQFKISRVPGTQIEQRRLRELLSGNPGEFENFIDGLWYYVDPQGTPDNRQYIYFDPHNRELIFYGDEAQQVFTWQNSSATRYGLYVSSQNISVTTLRRSLDIELESLDSIKVKVFEDVRLKVLVSASWDGSYRRAGSFEAAAVNPAPEVSPYIDAVYDGSIGKLIFNKDGDYELYAEGAVRTGKYAFFPLEDQELLELKPGNISGLPRETYIVEREAAEPGERGVLTLVRVRLGTRGIQELHEAAISLLPVSL